MGTERKIQVDSIQFCRVQAGAVRLLTAGLADLACNGKMAPPSPPIDNLPKNFLWLRNVHIILSSNSSLRVFLSVLFLHSWKTCASAYLSLPAWLSPTIDNLAELDRNWLIAIIIVLTRNNNVSKSPATMAPAPLQYCHLRKHPQLFSTRVA